MSQMFDYIKNGGDEVALLKAQLEHMGGALEREIELNASLRAEVEAKDAIAKRLSDTLLKLRPLGGSELFVRHGEQYLADAAYFAKIIDEDRERLHEARKGEALARKGALAAEQALALAREEERERALGAIQNLRHAAAANFTDANCQGQRGEDRTNALYDAYEAVRTLPADTDAKSVSEWVNRRIVAAALRSLSYPQPSEAEGAAWRTMESAPSDFAGGKRFLFGRWSETEIECRFDWIVSGFFDGLGEPWHDGKHMQAFHLQKPTHFREFDFAPPLPAPPSEAVNAPADGDK